MHNLQQYPKITVTAVELPRDAVATLTMVDDWHVDLDVNS